MPSATFSSAATVAASPGGLWGRGADALLLGGVSVIAYIALQALSLTAGQLVTLGAVMFALAHFVNHPHFAHSYQIFYASWTDVRRASPAAPWRWWWAGAVAPLLLALALALSAWRAVAGDLLWLGLCINFMGLLVGWHYVKQGFGMAMTDAALLRSWWPAPARQALLVNAYVCWATAWLLVNTMEAGRIFWGYVAWQPKVPSAVLALALSVCLASTLRTSVVVARAVRDIKAAGRTPPWNGLLAYVVTLYLWTVFAAADPAYLLMIPFFHSLQYLAVVWRYKANEWRAAGRGQGAAIRFLAVGVLMGAAGFWWLPVGIESLWSGQLDFDPKGPALGLACAWLFINVHHYLIDNVLWRKDNPRVNQFLFGQEAKPD
jgi:hypothetical protein